MPGLRASSRLSSTRKFTVRSIAIWKKHGLQSRSFWRKSTTKNACIRRSAIVRLWSSSAACGRQLGKDVHEFFEAWGIYRSDNFCSAGSKRRRSLPAFIGRDEFQSAIPWQVALQQSLPPLRRLSTILRNHNPPYNDCSANGNNPLNLLSQPKGAVQTAPFPCNPIPKINPTQSARAQL
jgi:hypothetical protein